MSDNHLTNILKLAERKGAISPKTLLLYLRSGPSDDMASMAFEEEQSRIFDAPVWEALDDLKAEAIHRGLFWLGDTPVVDIRDRHNDKTVYIFLLLLAAGLAAGIYYA